VNPPYFLHPLFYEKKKRDGWMDYIIFQYFNKAFGISIVVSEVIYLITCGLSIVIYKELLLI
jgi:hypothetical protein